MAMPCPSCAVAVDDEAEFCPACLGDLRGPGPRPPRPEPAAPEVLSAPAAVVALAPEPAPPQTPCPDHPDFPAAGTCERCGRFFCVRCFPGIVTGASGRCPPCQAREPTGHKSIGGWLILVAIGLVLTPFQLVSGAVPYFSALSQENLLEGARPIYVVALLSTGGLLGASLWASAAFFRRKRVAPRRMIILYALAVVSTVLDMGLAQAMTGLSGFVTDDAGPAVTGLELVGPIIRAAIWIPYFLASQRVKETFVVD